MRTTLLLVLLLGAILASPEQGYSDDGGRLHLNDREISDVGLLVPGGSVWIPLRTVFASLGYPINFNEGERSITVSRPGETFTVRLDSALTTVNDEQVSIDHPVRLVDGREYVSLDLLEKLPQLRTVVSGSPETGDVVIRLLGPVYPSWKAAQDAQSRFYQLGILKWPLSGFPE